MKSIHLILPKRQKSNNNEQTKQDTYSWQMVAPGVLKAITAAKMLNVLIDLMFEVMCFGGRKHGLQPRPARVWKEM